MYNSIITLFPEKIEMKKTILALVVVAISISGYFGCKYLNTPAYSVVTECFDEGACRQTVLAIYPMDRIEVVTSTEKAEAVFSDMSLSILSQTTNSIMSGAAAAHLLSRQAENCAQPTNGCPYTGLIRQHNF